ncbi:hypothetical protein L1887_50887 [Cichorium endivia]|nr:hypothetical protein L1887_50887 [Cichorium endivia]
MTISSMLRTSSRPASSWARALVSAHPTSQLKPHSVPRLSSQQRRWHAATPVDHPAANHTSKPPPPPPIAKQSSVTRKTDAKASGSVPPEIPRNEVGVQLLPRRLHEQLFPPTMDPVPPIAPKALNICRDHLRQHGLKASDASTLPQTAFDLPPLQGKDLAEHFWTIGREVAQPWLSMATRLSLIKPTNPPEELEETSSAKPAAEDFRFEAAEWLELDPALRTSGHLKPVTWSVEPGWTKYPILRSKDNSAVALGPGVSVAHPDPKDDMLVFDVETMVQEGPFPVMATAASPNAWYSWLSPWLVGRGDGHERKDHLIPLGPSSKDDPPRLVVGHNVSYDRARTLEEYTLELGSTRWLDTMSLHVATRGISSPQRPAWMKHNKAKAEKRAKKLLEQAALKEETRRAIENALSGLEYDSDQLEGLKLEALAMDAEQVSPSTGPTESAAVDSSGATASPSTLDMPFSDDESGGLASRVSQPSSSESQWLEETSKNSLADVARLHRIPMKVSKSARNVFVDGASRQEILQDVQHLLSYCASDVTVTHEIFRRTWPDFVARCPHPATMAGVFGLGSTFLPVDDEWIDYQHRCDEQFNRINDQVQKCLVELAEKLRDEGTRDVPWSLAAKIAGERQMMTDPERLEPVFPDPNRARAWWEDDACGAGPTGEAILSAILSRDASLSDETAAQLRTLAESIKDLSEAEIQADAQLAQLDWSLKDIRLEEVRELQRNKQTSPETDGENDGALASIAEPAWWPKWYWDLYKSATGELQVTIRSSIAPVLLKISWRGCPLYRSREHGWVFRHDPANQELVTRQTPLAFGMAADGLVQHLAAPVDVKGSKNKKGKPKGKGASKASSMPALVVKAYGNSIFYKVPHSEGEEANVGSPFAKSFIAYFEDGTLQSQHPDEVGRAAAKTALDLNAQCSYWIAVRDRVHKQMVVWDGQAGTAMKYPEGASGARQDKPGEAARRKGLILPQVVSMGTVTRRAIENTWLTASNARRIESVRSSRPCVMGDAQFGIHGATAVGWMTLEGTKALGTDLHSKTASILGTSRNQAKVFKLFAHLRRGHQARYPLAAQGQSERDERGRDAESKGALHGHQGTEHALG